MVATAVLYLVVATAALVFTVIEDSTPDFERNMGFAMLGVLLPLVASAVGSDDDAGGNPRADEPTPATSPQ